MGRVARFYLLEFAGLFLLISAAGPAGADSDRDFLSRQAAKREVSRTLEESRKSVDELVATQRSKLGAWTSQSRKSYSEYYKVALELGPDSPEARAAHDAAARGDREFWDAKGQEIQGEWKEFDKQSAKRSEKTRVALERIGVRNLGFLGELPNSTSKASHKPQPQPVPLTAGDTPGAPEAPETLAPASPARPVWVLDGSQVPKELVFPGKGKR